MNYRRMPSLGRSARWTRLGAAFCALSLLLMACAPAAPAQPTTAPAKPTAAPAAKPAEAAKPAAGQAPTAAPVAKATTAAQPKVVPEGELRLALGTHFRTLDAHLETTTSLITAMFNVFDTLVTFDENLKLVPSLAESWRAVDANTWEFKLRQGVKFHNGEPFNAAAAKWNFDRLLETSKNSASHGQQITDVDGVTAVDDYTLRLHTKEPSGTLPNRLQLMAMMSPKTWQELGPEKAAQTPVGTGPYKFSQFVKDERLVLEASTDHWRGAPAYAKLTIRTIPEDATRLAALLANEVDIAVNMPPELIPRIERGDLRIESTRTTRNMHVAINMTRDEVKDIRVRQALNHAVDVDAIIKNVFNGYAMRTAGPCGPEIFGCPNDLKPYEYNPDKARQLLAEAGLAGKELVFENSEGRYVKSIEAGQAIASYWEKVGLQVKHVVNDWTTLSGKIRNGNVGPVFYYSFGNSFADADSLFGYRFDSDRRNVLFEGPEIEAKIKKERTITDQAAREKAASDIIRDLYTHAPVVFLYDSVELAGVSQKVDWKARADESMWMFPAKPKR